MTEFIAGGAVTLTVALIGASVAWYQAHSARASAKEAREATKVKEAEEMLARYRRELEEFRNKNHLAFMWNREMYDHIYKQKPPPPPPPPPGLLDD